MVFIAVMSDSYRQSRAIRQHKNRINLAPKSIKIITATKGATLVVYLNLGVGMIGSKSNYNVLYYFEFSIPQW